MSYFKNCYCGLICLCCASRILAQQAAAPPIKKPVTLQGSVSASGNFYYSNLDTLTRPEYSWNLYGGFRATAGNVALPFSFVVNHYSNSTTPLYFQMGVSPTYRWIKGHLGYRSIPFSPLIFEGQSFRGAGVELTPKRFRFAAFYGRLNRAFNQDTSRVRFRLPQYSRTGYGTKVGYGNTNNFIDLMYFHATDDSASAEINPVSKNAFKAQENAVVGASFRITFFKKMTLSGDVASSALTRDLSLTQRSPDSTAGFMDKLFSKLMLFNASTVSDLAGQSTLTFFTQGYNTSLSYRRVGAAFKSLGTPYIFNNVELITWLNDASLAEGKLSITTSLSTQQDNLKKTDLTEMGTQVGNLNVFAMLGRGATLNLNLSGYNLHQKNGNPEIPPSERIHDSLLLHQQIAQVSLNPAYNFTKGSMTHFINANLNYMRLEDKTPKLAPVAHSNNLSSSLNYSLSLSDKPYSFSLSGMYSSYRQDTISYTSYGPTVGISAQLLKDRNLNLQGNVGYLFNQFNATDKQRNITYSLNTNYQLNRHALNLFAYYIHTPRNPITERINEALKQAVASKNLNGGITYTYSLR